MTKEDIKARAAQYEAKTSCSAEARMAFTSGAFWANEQNKVELAALRAENAKLRDLLERCYPRALKADYTEAREALSATTPDPLYLAAPEMLELLQDISSPRRGSESENWQIEPRAVQLAARLVDKATFNPADLDEF